MERGASDGFLLLARTLRASYRSGWSGMRFSLKSLIAARDLPQWKVDRPWPASHLHGSPW